MLMLPTGSSASRYHHHHSPRLSLLDGVTTTGFLIASMAVLLLVYTLTTVVTYAKVTETEAMTSAAAAATAAVVASGVSAAGQQQQLVNNNNQGPIADIATLQRTFPIHVGNDMEVIMHPAIKIVNDMNKNKNYNNNNAAAKAQRRGAAALPDDVQETMRVPKFFDESHGYVYDHDGGKDGGTIRHYLGDGKTLMTPEQAASIGSKIPRPSKPEEDKKVTKGNSFNDHSEMMETIYCSIASYRDPECAGSIEDLYARAKYPERIRVAILDQRLPNSNDPICSQPIQPCEQDPEQAMCKYRHLMDVYEMDARLAVGPVFARHLAHRFYRGEYFAMQIDSHVRFVEHWDEDMVGQWKSAKNEMAVLTTYLSDIINSIDPVTHEGKHWGRPIMCQSDYEGSGESKHLRHGQQPEGLPGITGEPTLHPFWAAGFSFARGHFAIQVPYDQHLPMVFQGEEISIGLRGFTYGYDYYAPERSVCFHMYAVKENEKKRKSVPLFWENARMYQGTGVRAMKRLNSIIGMAGPYDPSEFEQDDLVKYGLGQVRTTEKFFKVYGIHVKEQKVEHHLCRFVGKKMMMEFKPALRENGMGLDFDKINYEFVDPFPDQK